MAFVDPISLTDLKALRHQIHARPEPGWAEFESTARAMNHMQTLGFEVRCGREVIDDRFIRGANNTEIEQGQRWAREHGVSEAVLARLNGVTGCVGIFNTGKPGPVTAFRFELDALPIQETDNPEHTPNKEGFRSENPGYMHACGHDSHQAVGLCLATWIAKNKEHLKGTMKLVFQPAEEGVRGARPLAESGILDDVDMLFCQHIGSGGADGTVITAPEKFLCTTKVDYRFIGKPSHAGMEPEVGRNALMAGSTAALSLMALPRSGKGMTRVNVGYLQAGEGRNIVPSTAMMKAEVRGETAEINEGMFAEAQSRVEGAASMYGVSVQTVVMGEAVDFIADTEAEQVVIRACQGVPNIQKLEHTMNFNGSEDATILLRRVQQHGGKGAYIVVGATITQGHHQPGFDFDEKYLETMYGIFRNIATERHAR